MKRIKTPVIIALLVIVIIAVFVCLFTDISLASILIILALITVMMYFSGLLKTYSPKDRKLIKEVKKIAAQSQTTEEFKNTLNNLSSSEIFYIKTCIYMNNGRIKGKIIFCRDPKNLEIEL